MAYMSEEAVKARFEQVPGSPWGTGRFPDDDALARIIADTPLLRHPCGAPHVVCVCQPKYSPNQIRPAS